MIVGLSSMKKTEFAFLKMTVTRMEQSPFLQLLRNAPETRFFRHHVARLRDVPKTSPFSATVSFREEVARECASVQMINSGMIKTKSAWKSVLKNPNARQDLK